MTFSYINYRVNDNSLKLKPILIKAYLKNTICSGLLKYMKSADILAHTQI